MTQNMAPFTMQQKVLFKHCDPAGIAFFPRFFEIMNDCVEMFFSDALGVPFETLHLTHSVPTAGIKTQFLAPSRHGDVLDLALATKVVGGSSWTYRMTASCAGQLRFETEATLVYVDNDGRPTRWPDGLRQALENYEVRNDT